MCLTRLNTSSWFHFSGFLADSLSFSIHDPYKFFSTPDIILMLQCFVNWAAVSITDSAWHQAQLTLQKSWLGLCSISHHAVLHIFNPFVLLDIVVQVMCTFRYAVDVYNNQVLVSNKITIHITGPSSQRFVF